MEPRSATSASYKRTSLGKAEIQARAHELSRSSRTLLLIIDPSHPAEHWLGLVRASTSTDLQMLQFLGLIEHTEMAQPLPVSKDALDLQALHECIGRLDFAHLYQALNVSANEILGLIAGFRFVLRIEQCSDLHDLRAFAAEFVDRIYHEHGAEALQRLLLRLRQTSPPP
jgi:hypothetical protein